MSGYATEKFHWKIYKYTHLIESWTVFVQNSNNQLKLTMFFYQKPVNLQETIQGSYFDIVRYEIERFHGKLNPYSMLLSDGVGHVRDEQHSTTQGARE